MNLIADLHEIREAALQAIEPGNAVLKIIGLKKDKHGVACQLQVGESFWKISDDNRLFLAAIPMVHAVNDRIGELLHEGIAIIPNGFESDREIPSKIKVFKTGHPTPNKSGLMAAHAVEKFLMESMTEKDRLLVLLSGGASALLLKAGATIQEINTLRKHIECLKGGQLARLAHPAPLATFILSDVVGNQLDVVG